VQEKKVENSITEAKDIEISEVGVRKVYSKVGLNKRKLSLGLPIF
jgi:hypothetical protein